MSLRSILNKPLVSVLLSLFIISPISFSSDLKSDTLALGKNWIKDSTIPDNGYAYAQYFYHEEIQPLDLGVSMGNLFLNGHAEHIFMMGGVSTVKQGKYARFNFKFPLSMLTIGLVQGLDYIFLKGKYKGNDFNSPFYNILTVPNSIWRLELVDHFRISAGMLTDYLLYRHHGLDPGILYTSNKITLARGSSQALKRESNGSIGQRRMWSILFFALLGRCFSFPSNTRSVKYIGNAFQF